MIKAYIIGPVLGPDLYGIVTASAQETAGRRLSEIYARQIAALNTAGIGDIEIVHRNRPDGTFLHIDPDETDLTALFVRFDAVLDQEMLYFMTRSRAEATILTASRTSHLRCLDSVEHDNGRLAGSGVRMADKGHLDEEFYGVAALRNAVAAQFLAAVQSDRVVSMADALDALCLEHDIYVVRWTQIGAKPQHRAGGGSYARSNLVTRFRKEARELGRRKLRDEIRFLGTLPTTLKPLYPEVVNSGETEEMVFMEQEFLPLVTMRHYLFTGQATADTAVGKIETILDRLNELAYAPFAQPSPADYLDQYHFQRLWHRLKHTLDRAPVFEPLFAAKRLWINGRPYHNVPQLLFQFERSEKARRMALPDTVSPYVHGDLHFENIMVDPASDAFRLVDPRGYDYCDLYYDLGKISHSTNGKYDFVHENRYALAWSVDGTEAEATFMVTPSPILDLYDEINQALGPLYREVTGDPLAEERTLFAEAMHFCTMMPFHLIGDGREDKSVAIYLTGALLFNQVLERFGLPAADTNAPVGPDYWGQQEWRNVG